MLRSEECDALHKHGIPFIEVLNRSPESGYFLLLDFSQYAGMYHRQHKIQHATDLARVFIEEGKLLTLPSAFFLGDTAYPMSLRVTYGTFPKNLVNFARALSKGLSSLSERPVDDLDVSSEA